MLVANLHHKRMMFGGKVVNSIKTAISSLNGISIEDLKFDTFAIEVVGEEPKKGQNKACDFIEHLNLMIDLTKKELTLIEVRLSPTGNQTFDLPSTLRSPSDPRRARKDSYTALLLANYGMYCYYTIHTEVEEVDYTFVPRFIGGW